MNPADEMAARIGATERQSAGPAAIDKLDEQLRVSVEALLHPSPPPKPVEEVDDLLLAKGNSGFRYLVAICIGRVRL